jgi:protoheme IX farnesyltransferase
VIKKIFQLAKPGIIRANAVTAVAGFLFASRGDVDIPLLIAVFLGVAFVIAGAGTLNNYTDRFIDKKMERTKKRALVVGAVNKQSALVIGLIELIIGFAILAIFTNTLTFYLGIIAVVFYNVLYAITKRRTIHGTLVGAVPGALPMVAGYTTVTSGLDGAAAVLFLSMVFWQMAHFYAIGIFRLKEYKAANLSIMSVVKGPALTKTLIIAYMIAFMVTIPLLTILGYSGLSFAILSIFIGLYWLRSGLNGYEDSDSTKQEAWARSVFKTSLYTLVLYCVILSINVVLP